MHANSTGDLNSDIDIEEKEHQCLPKSARGIWGAEVGSTADCSKEEPSASVIPVLRGRHLLHLTPLLKVFPPVLSFLNSIPGPKSTMTVILSYFPSHSSLSPALGKQINSS